MEVVVPPCLIHRRCGRRRRPFSAEEVRVCTAWTLEPLIVVRVTDKRRGDQ